jgi:hypothetical protein
MITNVVDIARFGEDETVIMRREGGWIRVYRAHHKADTMTTAATLPKPCGTSMTKPARTTGYGQLWMFPVSVGE